MLVIAPDLATGLSRRWVVLPLSTEQRLAINSLAYTLQPSPANGLRQTSFVMTWLPTAVHADHLQGPLGRLPEQELKAIAAAVIQSLDLHCQEPWQPDQGER